MPLITPADYDWIRKRIDAALNAQSLPPDVILSYLAESEEWVEARVDVNGLDASQLAHAERAARYYCASLIAPTVNIPTSDAGIAGASYTRRVLEPQANAARLLALAVKELDAATPAVETAVRVGRAGSAQAETRW